MFKRMGEDMSKIGTLPADLNECPEINIKHVRLPNVVHFGVFTLVSCSQLQKSNAQ